MTNEWSIQQIARLAGTTSRTLRHYGELGLLSPLRVGENGYRYYDAEALVRLQRILLLRELGIGLPQIAEILARPTSQEGALEAHLAWLEQESRRLDRQIAAVATTIENLRGGEQLMAEKMFDGFDHTAHRDEVVQRWGADAYAAGDAWWRGLGADKKAQWQRSTAELAAEWAAAAERGVDPRGTEAQLLAERHVAWLTGIPGTPASDPDGDVTAYVVGLADMYVADPRFAQNYGGDAGARFVRDALRHHMGAED